MRSIMVFCCMMASPWGSPIVAEDRPPNVIIIFADDLGYADLGCFGARGWSTPYLDQLAREGVRCTSFYVSQPVCSASRASLLTGCYANRIGIHGALGPNARHGIADAETTLGELFKSKGYATAIVGKWHLGHHRPFLPTRHGFDDYFGLPYSNDMWPHHPEKVKFPPLPLIENERIVVQDVTAKEQALLTTLYTERSRQFIQTNKDRPFFLYFAHSMPHVPLFVSDRFKGRSKQGLYGDVIEEIDWSVGELLKTLKEHGLDRNTLVIFTSDNGPWLSYGHHAGDNGPLREGKGSVWEGGIRVPFIAWWPGKLPAGSIQDEPLMTIDLFPTLAHLIGGEMPKLPLDGKDVWPLLQCEEGAKSPHEVYYFYYGQNELQALRRGSWKLILPHVCRMIEDRSPGRDGNPSGYRQVKLSKPLLFDLSKDLGETTDLSEQFPDVMAELEKWVEAARQDLGDRLTNRVGKGVRSPGRLPEDQ